MEGLIVKRIVLILALISIIFQMKAQVPNNVSQPYSVSNSLNINLDKIKTINLVKPIEAIYDAGDKDIYAVDIKTNINIVETGTKKTLVNGKSLTSLRLKANEAKSLNFSFENFYLSKNSKMFIYSLDKKQVMGPITNANNNKIFNTHIILCDEVIIELVSDSNSSDKITLSNLAYGLKDPDYFMNINEETYEKYNIQTSICETIYDSRHDCNYLGKSSGVNMKQPNCPAFDNLDKAKRAICVIISHNSDSNHWQAKGGILINTASDVYPNESDNYCNSYVLTCTHCLTGYGSPYPFVDPTNIVVRFNWLRKECAIPPGILPCLSDSSAWEDLINYDEVIDYCDVTLIQRDYANSWGRQSAVGEYAFLKINEPLRFKEYFNGWKIYTDTLVYKKRLETLMGQWGGNPMEAKLETMKIEPFRMHLEIEVNKISDGHSGLSLFEDGYLTGIFSNKIKATSIGLMYYNDSIWSNTNPREILDPDNIYESIFDNKDSIVQEGVERYEKSNCLKSNVNCNPTLNLSNYITAIPGEGCCFRLEYIPAMTGFIGGTPYGIRIYRDNDSQNTLYYDFGSSIFAGSSSNYYNPALDNVIEFCVDPDELAADGGKIVIEFQDANGRIICVKEVELECLDCCSDENLKAELSIGEFNPICCADFKFTIDSAHFEDCGFKSATIVDNITSQVIFGDDIIPWQDSLYSIPITICNYDTITKTYRVEFYNDEEELICSKEILGFLIPCEITFMRSSEGDEKDIFELKTKTVKQKEITFEYFTKEDELIEIELFNKYNISQGVIQSKQSQKGTTEFSLNIENIKPDIYVFKMRGEKESVIRKLIIEK